MIHYPDAAVIEQIARAAVAAMPDLFRQHLDGVAVHVEEFADRETLDSLDIASPWGLLGVYQGRPMTERSIWVSGELPARIRLFRRPLLAERDATGVDLHDLIVHVLVHEVGHHFGYSDEEMEEIDEGED
ncbi:MAG: metallopeptidase family protein [Sphingobium sp.]|nr:metallopeptidase family protein [Sphingobium sp.]